MRRFIFPLPLIIITFFILTNLPFPAGAVAGAENEPIRLVFSTHFPVAYRYAVEPIYAFAEKVEKESGGRVKIKIYHSGQLFDGKAEFAALARGDIDLTSPNFVYHTDIIPEYGIINLPFLFRSPESLQKMIRSGLYDLGIRQKLSAHNIFFLSPGVGDPYQFYSNGMPVRSPADISGRRWGVSGNIHRKAVEIMGGISQTLGSGQLYMAFQKNRIDGCTRPLITGYGRKLHETVDHITLANFAFLSCDLCINKQKWDSLPPDIRSIIRKAAAERSDTHLNMVKSFIKESVRFMESKGVNVHRASSEEIGVFKKAMSPVYEWWMDQVPEGRKYLNFVKTRQAPAE